MLAPASGTCDQAAMTAVRSRREESGGALALLGSRFFGPLKYAILPDVLAPGELLLGNALVEAGTFIAILLGTIAGMLVATRHGSAAVAGLIIAVALVAWAASWGIPHTSPAARRSGA